MKSSHGRLTQQLSLILIGAALVVLGSHLWAQDPGPNSWDGRIPYEGRLDVQGVPYQGPADMTFALYTTAEGGEALWAEELLGVPVSSGAFSVVLGEATDHRVPQVAFQRQSLYLEIAVNGVPLSHRQRIYATPFSITSAHEVPIGTIVAWHKSLDGTPDLPEGWVECNGQTITDEESPYQGRPVPDLNGDARFLRGGLTSGTLQGDQLQAHTHTDAGHAHSFTRPRWFASETLSGDHMYTTSDTSANSQPWTTANGHASLGEPTVSSGGTPRIGAETRPVNMSVVWIIKIK